MCCETIIMCCNFIPKSYHLSNECSYSNHFISSFLNDICSQNFYCHSRDCALKVFSFFSLNFSSFFIVNSKTTLGKNVAWQIIDQTFSLFLFKILFDQLVLFITFKLKIPYNSGSEFINGTKTLKKSEKPSVIVGQGEIHMSRS